ncbi:MAG: GGDEF domain-containing protein [Deltaproteobacteria bacterium]|nr:GGDEF domain-containing protein [Deltaproteobacteria bacterium]
MRETILLISEDQGDLGLFKEILGTDRFSINQISLAQDLGGKILESACPLILADYDLVRDKTDIFFELQKSRSKACLIFFGEKFEAEEAAQILQKGVYSIIPRSLLSERIHDAIVGGLENRKAFIEILGMMDELKDVNKRLEDEKSALRGKNQELSFINRLSREVSYDLNWDRILPRMMDTGLKEILDYSLFGILYRIGANWNLALHLTENGLRIEEDIFKSEVLSRIFDERGKITDDEITLQLISPEVEGDKSASYLFPYIRTFPLSLAGKRLGAVALVPREAGLSEMDKEELMAILSNLLSLSLKNAQEYHRLREATVTDSLTGIYNRKGLGDFLQKEFQRAKRYKKVLSFVMIDMNDFKSVNDSFGHQAGDYVLRELAGCLKALIRQSDIVARYGGDEFAILLPETESSEAEVLMRRVSHEIEGHFYEWGSQKIKIGMSYGISNTDELNEGDTEVELVQRADSLLYASKQS